VVAVAAWTGFFSLIAFWMLRRAGRLRVDQVTELAGLDNMEHGGPAYPEFNLVPYNTGSVER
jgi:Amt family ammonium transporter